MLNVCKIVGILASMVGLSILTGDVYSALILGFGACCAMNVKF